MYNFENLRVYQHSMDLVKSIYLLTKKFPKEEQFVLVDQLKRSSISIVLNIAEGRGSSGDKEFSRFLTISLKSLYETVANLTISRELYSLQIDQQLMQCEKIGKELNSLINRLKKPSAISK